MSKPSKTKAGNGSAPTIMTVHCSFCGGEHRRRSRELDECRRLHRKGKEAVVAIPEPGRPKNPGDETTHYENDPLRGNSRAHAINRKRKSGWTDRKIAKYMDIPLADVQAVER